MPDFTFRRRQRLSRDRDYKAVFDARVRKHRGPLTVFALPNNLAHHRLGLSIGRRIGNAVARNHLKRMIREAFRLHQHEFPGAYDLVVTSRPHEPLALEEYARHLADAVHALHREWTKRAAADREPADA